MQMAYTNTIVFIILFLGIAGGMVALEIFLARSGKIVAGTHSAGLHLFMDIDLLPECGGSRRIF